MSIVKGVLDAYSEDKLRMGLYQAGERDVSFITFSINRLSHFSNNPNIELDFKIENGLLNASTGVKKLNKLTDGTSRTLFTETVMDLLIYLVKNSAIIILGEEDIEVQANKLRISKSTMTIGISYKDSDGWHTRKLIYNSKKSGMTQGKFKFRIDEDYIEGLNKYSDYLEDIGGGIFEYNSRLRVTPIVEEGSYMVCPPYYHERINHSLTCAGIISVMNIMMTSLEEQLEQQSEKAVQDSVKRESDVSSEAIIVKGASVRPSDIKTVTDWIKLKSTEQWRDKSLDEFSKFIFDNYSKNWKLIVFRYLAEVASLKTSVVLKELKLKEDKEQLLTESVIADLDLYKHRLYILVNEIKFVMPEFDMPTDNLYITGGFSNEVFEFDRRR